MATAFLDGYRYANGRNADNTDNPDFLHRVTMAVAKLCASISSEDPAGLSLPTGFKPSGYETTDEKKQRLHDLRMMIVARCRNNPGEWGKNFAYAIASDPNSANVGPASSDSDIEFSVSAVWNSFATSIIG